MIRLRQVIYLFIQPKTGLEILRKSHDSLWIFLFSFYFWFVLFSVLLKYWFQYQIGLPYIGSESFLTAIPYILLYCFLIIAGNFLLAALVTFFAPAFSAERDFKKTFQLVALSSVIYLLFAPFSGIKIFQFLWAIALCYSFFVFYRGLDIFLLCPLGKRIFLGVISALCMFGVLLVVRGLVFLLIV